MRNRIRLCAASLCSRHRLLPWHFRATEAATPKKLSRKSIGCAPAERQATLVTRS